VFGLTVGWRWAFVAGCAMALTGVLLVRGATGERPQPAGRSGGRPTSSAAILVPLCVGIALGASAAGALGTFLTTTAVEYGLSRGFAGVLAAIGGAICIVVRIRVGLRADRLGRHHLKTVAVMMFVGAAAFAGMATGSAAALVLLTPLAFGAGWGWPGLFNLAIVLANPEAPGAATGITQTGTYLGAMAGPATFGWLAGSVGFGAAWLFGAAALALGAIAIRIGRARVRAARVEVPVPPPPT
jgi:predicted MFS family arabinose efflux permease